MAVFAKIHCYDRLEASFFQFIDSAFEQKKVFPTAFEMN